MIDKKSHYNSLLIKNNGLFGGEKKSFGNSDKILELVNRSSSIGAEELEISYAFISILIDFSQ
jgi:hypothetical protein